MNVYAVTISTNGARDIWTYAILARNPSQASARALKASIGGDPRVTNVRIMDGIPALYMGDVDPAGKPHWRVADE